MLVAGLTARTAAAAVGASLAYGLWDQAIWLPDVVRVGLAAAMAVAGLIVALVHPGGRPLDQSLRAWDSFPSRCHGV